MRDAVCGSEDEVISSVVDKMVKNDIGAIIIVKNELLVGIITERDILEKVINPGKDPKKTFAKDVMTKHVITVGSDRSICFLGRLL